MDKDEFQAKLAKIATFTRNSDANQYDRRWADDRNETHGIVLMQRLESDHVCEDCGKVCHGKPGRNHTKRNGRWHESCTKCRLVRCPTTGKMLPFNQVKKPMVSK